LAQSRATAIHRVSTRESTTALCDRKDDLRGLLAEVDAVTQLEISAQAWLEVARCVAFCLEQATIQRADQPEHQWPSTEEIQRLAITMDTAIERLDHVKNAATQQEANALCLLAAGCVSLLRVDTSLNLAGHTDALALISATVNLLRSYLANSSVLDGPTVVLTLDASSIALDLSGHPSSKRIRFAWLLAQSAWRNGAKLPRSVPKKVTQIANEIQQVESTRSVRDILQQPIRSSIVSARGIQPLSGPFNMVDDPGPRRGVLARYEYMLMQRRRGIAIEAGGYMIITAIFVFGLIQKIPGIDMLIVKGQFSAIETLTLNIALITYVATVTIALAIGQAPDARQGPFITSRDKTWRPFAAASSKFCGALSLAISLLAVKLDLDLVGFVTLVLGALALILSVGVAGWEGHGFDRWERRYLRARARLRWLLPIGKKNRHRSKKTILTLLTLAVAVPTILYVGIIAIVVDRELDETFPVDWQGITIQAFTSIALQFVLMIMYFVWVGQGRRGGSLLVVFVFVPLILVQGLAVAQMFIDTGFGPEVFVALTGAILVSTYPLIAWILCLVKNMGPGTAAKDAGMRVAVRWPGLMA
jgi:hypothetical protein